MRLARVVGNVVSTVKERGYYGYKLMLVEYFDPESGVPQGPRMIAFDCADAGIGDTVLVNTDGGAGNMLLNDDFAIVDLVICGVVDSYAMEGRNLTE
ncbi:MAG TPA: EutN/CcmL family microcompartment protein [Candidatus Merdiplasma excrementigallinarum]|uniref:EutN/CcmL family microcompartment protein n=1 Tax=Candidatus Merdiplasma excrementigallinarum TaxID=2840864 RepID=A0A9D1P0E1_9FIRM|nr:EutN/CcmL family microcompartment protein [Candidatus Merdiplasma excrementigallinarum]